MKKKILVTTGTRAEYGILRPIIKEIHENKKLDLILVVTGTHLSKKHGFTINEIKKDGFPISAKIDFFPKGNDSFSMTTELGNGIISFAKLFKKFKPDINLILGDRDEVLASAISAYHMNIPNAHIHGGDISGGLDEYTRHAITKISNIHFAVSRKSMNRILKMGENKKFVFFTGSPSIDEIYQNKISSKKDLFEKYNLNFNGDEIILLQHSVTTEIEKTEKNILNTLKAITPLQKKIIAIIPNSDPGYQNIIKNLERFSKTFLFLKLYTNLPRNDFLGMIKHGGVLVGNSSSGFIEASYFDTPVVNIGDRQKNRESGKNVINVSQNSIKSIQEAVKKSLKQKKIPVKNGKIYGNGKSTQKIVQILEKIVINESLMKKQISY